MNRLQPIETEGQNHDEARKLGRFVASVEVINSSVEDARAVMSGIVVLEAVTRDGIIHYVALCEQFAALEEGDEIPEYRALIAKDEGKIVSVRWEMVEAPSTRRLNWDN